MSVDRSKTVAILLSRSTGPSFPYTRLRLPTQCHVQGAGSLCAPSACFRRLFFSTKRPLKSDNASATSQLAKPARRARSLLREKLRITVPMDGLGLELNIERLYGRGVTPKRYSTSHPPAGYAKVEQQSGKVPHGRK
jgi:hypothetical protein